MCFGPSFSTSLVEQPFEEGKEMRPVLYGGLFGFALPIVDTAFLRLNLSNYIPIIENCTLGNQMVGALFLSAPENAVMYGLIAWAGATILNRIRHLGRRRSQEPV
jgi:hypothetical protein